jgi:hypothetical protein
MIALNLVYDDPAIGKIICGQMRATLGTYFCHTHTCTLIHTHTHQCPYSPPKMRRMSDKNAF